MSARTLNTEAAASFLVTCATRDALLSRLKKHGFDIGIDLETETPVEKVAEILLKITGAKSQGDLMAIYLNVTIGCNEAHDASIATELLRVAFPDAKIGDRHGPHYISLARSGKLRLLDPAVTAIPHRRKARAVKADPVVAEPDTAAIAEEVNRLIEVRRVELVGMTRKELVAAAKSAGVKASGKKDAIVKRILAA